MRFVYLLGIATPFIVIATVLLAAAVLTAATAWDVGHRVTDLHPPLARRGKS